MIVTKDLLERLYKEYNEKYNKKNNRILKTNIF